MSREPVDPARRGLHGPGPYRAAIVGLSWIGADPPPPGSDDLLGSAPPFSHASAIATLPSLDLVAVCDIAAGARDRFVTTWGARFPAVHRYEDVGEMLAGEGIEVLSVVTPDDRHASVVLAAIEAGVPAIYCEKPLATTLEDADRIIAAAQRAGTVINVNHTRRWSPEVRQARRLAADGAIGDLAQIIVHQGGPRAMLYRNGSHFLDMINFLARSEPEWVVAEVDPEFASYGPRYAGDGGHDPASEPGYNAYIAYANGVRAFLADSKRFARDWQVLLLGSSGSIRVGADGVTLRQATPDGDFASRPMPPRWTMSGMQAALADLVDAARNGRVPACPPEEARTAIALAEAILQSQSMGNVPVRLAPAPARQRGTTS